MCTRDQICRYYLYIDFFVDVDCTLPHDAVIQLVKTQDIARSHSHARISWHALFIDQKR